MDYRDQVFMAVARHLNFSKAAAELHLSQPAVSKHIKTMEANMGTALFERRGNKVYLSKAGELTFIRLKEIFDLYQQLDYELGQLNDSHQGLLKIGASSTIAQYWLPRILASFHRLYPQIRLELHNGNSQQMEQGLLAREVDIALVENEDSHTDLRYVNFLEDEIVAVASPQSSPARKRNLSLKDLSQVPLVLREKGSGSLEIIEHALLHRSIELEQMNVILRLGSTEAIKNFLSDFDGIALLSKKALEKELQLKRLVQLEVRDFAIFRQFRIAMRQGPELKTAEILRKFILTHN